MFDMSSANSLLALFHSSYYLFYVPAPKETMPASLKSFSSSSESKSLCLFFENLPYPSYFNLVFISCLFCLMISIGLQPLQLQNLHPFGGKVALRWAFGTQQRQDLPDLENAFIHSMQHPFFMTNCVFFNPFLISPSNSPSDPPSFQSSRSSPTSFLSCSFYWLFPFVFSKLDSPKF